MAGEEAKARRRSMANRMLHDYGLGNELQRQNRADREVDMIQRLQSLVPESELQLLKKEFAGQVQMLPNGPNLLQGGAAQLAQKILIPRLRAPVPRHEQDEQAALKEALTQMRKEGGQSHSNDLAAHAQVKHIAKEIMQVSAKNATQCYHHAGFAEEEVKNQVAAALRLLEHELFRAEEGASEEATNVMYEEQNLYTVAPLLLAKPTAKRLLKQAQKEAEAQMQEGLRMEPFRRKARVKETLSTAPTQELEQEDDSDDSGRSDVADCGDLKGAGRARRRWSDQRLNAMLQRDWSPISSPRVTTRKGKVRSTQRGTEPHKQHDLEFQPEHLQWHPTVQELLNSVSTGAKRLKTTVRVNAMQRSASDTKLSPLPRVSASPQRGMRKEFNKVPGAPRGIDATVGQKKLLLESHHSRPQYVIKVMTWKGRNQSNGRWQSWQDWKSDQGQEKEKDKKKKEPSVARSQKSEVLELISYDGKRVALPDDKGAVGSSSASSSGLQEENKRLKDALKYFANKKEDEEAKQCDVLQTSPQKPIRGSGFTLPIEVLPSRQGDKSRSSSKERSRSPCRGHEEPALKLTDVVKEAGLEHLLAGMSPEHHDHLMAIITSEPANFQNPKQVQELIHTMMTQQLAEQTAVMDAGLEDQIKTGRRDVLKPFGLPRERSAKRPGMPLSERTANVGDHRRVSSRSADSVSHMSSME
ncbi:Hypothetical protein SCF082_LOCUS28266 [Durusdinium trenchii]|uniref:Uncharacterized protein n=1 Tax=Durusdinium trenchii TaxID=1381693 RepID=A0ABP0MJ42_9DINO